MTAQLLAFSRRQVLQPRLLDLNALVREFVPMLEAAIGIRSKVALELDPKLGTVRVDGAQLEQAVLNLAHNAGDAMPAGGVFTISTANATLSEEDGMARIGVRIHAGRYVALRVSDTGEGIMPPAMTHLFEPFFTTKKQGDGIGLGLSTVYGIVKQSEGYIWALSRPGQGAAFEIYLPMVDELTRDAGRTTGVEAVRRSPVLAPG